MQYVQKLFSAHLMELLGTGDVEGCFDSHGDGVNPSEVDARFCAECTMDMEIILGITDGTPR
jgi:hypothetical protein